MGRYAYGNQPDIAQWNLIRLAETLLPLLAEDHEAAIKEAQQAIGEFPKLFDAAYAAGLRRKLGLLEAQPNDMSLAQDLLDRMAHNGADFTLVFRFLCDAAAGPEGDTSARMLPLRATCNLPPAGVTSFEDDRLLLDIPGPPSARLAFEQVADRPHHAVRRPARQGRQLVLLEHRLVVLR
jgi:uncharacterized protein YdiU (UPF0061 family)